MEAVSNFFGRVRKKEVIARIDRFINSKYMLAVFALLSLLSNIFRLEILVYCITFCVALYTVLFGKDMLIIAAVVFFMYISPSDTNNPFIHTDSFFFPGNGAALWLIVAFILLFLVAVCVRIATDGGFVAFLGHKRALLPGFLLLFAPFLLGGSGYEKYDWRNITYSLLLIASFFLPYFFLTACVRWKEVPKDYFAWLGLIAGFTVVFELVNVFVIHADNIFSDGAILRHYIYTGWGTYTSMSVVMLICMPCAFYLAAVKKHGFIFNILGNLIYCAIVLSNGRGSILMGAVVYVLCAVAVLRRRNNRRANAVVYAVVLIGAAVAVGILHDHVRQLFAFILDPNLGDSNRFALFKDGLQRFFNLPLFGQGFYACPPDFWNNAGGATFLPAFWHNTFIQMLAACGIAGLAAYLFHRFQTLLLFFRKPGFAKTFMGFSVLGILLTCLLDCHLFNIGVGLIYSVILAFAEKSGEMEREAEDDLAASFFRRHQKKCVVPAAYIAAEGEKGNGGDAA